MSGQCNKNGRITMTIGMCNNHTQDGGEEQQAWTRKGVHGHSIDNQGEMSNLTSVARVSFFSYYCKWSSCDSLEIRNRCSRSYYVG